MADDSELEHFLSQRPSPQDLPDLVRSLKLHILNEGIPTSQDHLRPLLWSILLQAEPASTDKYLELVERGASPAYQKIRNDTFRTLATDLGFKNRVSELALIRLLNAHAWHALDREAEKGMEANGSGVPYVQGMNILAAPFLYACHSEVQAFELYETWLQRECPLYVQSPTLVGVHMGCTLLDRCLAQLDGKLAAHLKSKGLTAEVYAFPSIMTLSACTPPLQEVLVLWDFLVAYGPHLNVLCVLAQIIMMREAIMAPGASPMALLRKFPPLKGKTVTTLAVSWIDKLEPVLYEQLARHCWDATLMQELQ
ncbi:TBC-domain-containing protein [Protomyces lactucae-debilis]|uniref:TBC-domain-containing protein n=1 Tax=Protomyces lactucae-debilis TaxID=2754530 RepID=A0A1Y2FDG7_PROLT|nr:TBC-domain-containing protein [Protomyces lactucae-debilis]ORY81962.1 TBC-domain-containing protein [Protomyces lactucae-debilis]